MRVLSRAMSQAGELHGATIKWPQLCNKGSCGIAGLNGSFARIAPVLGIPRSPCRSAIMAVPGVQILAPRFREDLCLDAGEVIEAAEGVVTLIDPTPAQA